MSEDGQKDYYEIVFIIMSTGLHTDMAPKGQDQRAGTINTYCESFSALWYLSITV